MRADRFIGFGPRVTSRWSGEGHPYRVEVWWTGLRAFYVGLHVWGHREGVSIYPLPGVRIDIMFGDKYVPEPFVDPWTGEKYPWPGPHSPGEA